MKRLAVILVLLISLAGYNNLQAQVAVGVSVGVAPPALPVYAQPPCPVNGYLWSPGYWAWDPDSGDYYWVPGVWVAPPEVGLLWTPGYWGFVNGGYFWYAGYWGPTVGFYGGVCYGYGYGGHGFYGGRWVGGRFSYNTAAWHVNNTVIHNTYVDRTVIHNSGSRASFNGRGGVNAQPTDAERAAMNQHHVAATSAQRSNQRTASMNKSQFAKANGGHPSTTARSTVGGQRFTPAGHSISSAHTAATHPASANKAPSSNHISSRPQSRPQHNAVQSRPAPAPVHNAAPPRAIAPRQAPPSRGMGGGGRMGGGGGKKR